MIEFKEPRYLFKGIISKPFAHTRAPSFHVSVKSKTGALTYLQLAMSLNGRLPASVWGGVEEVHPSGNPPFSSSWSLKVVTSAPPALGVRNPREGSSSLIFHKPILKKS